MTTAAPHCGTAGDGPAPLLAGMLLGPSHPQHPHEHGCNTSTTTPKPRDAGTASTEASPTPRALTAQQGGASPGSPLSTFLRRKLQAKAPIASPADPSLPTSPACLDPQCPRAPNPPECASPRGRAAAHQGETCRMKPGPARAPHSLLANHHSAATDSKVTQRRELTCVKISERLVNLSQGTGACLALAGEAAVQTTGAGHQDIVSGG